MNMSQQWSVPMTTKSVRIDVVVEQWPRLFVCKIHGKNFNDVKNGLLHEVTATMIRQRMLMSKTFLND